jgi:hypothetical protein
MSALVTTDEVRAIYQTTRTDLSVFINMAHGLVDELLMSCNLSDDRLKAIELWLSAHFASVGDGNADIVEESAGNTRTRWSDPGGNQATSEGLNMTIYGRQALALDTCGVLSGIGRRHARFTVV